MSEKMKKKSVYKVGRPTKYQKKFCELLVNHMARGFSFESFGGLDEVCAGRNTIYSWLEAHSDFRDAKDVGEVKCRQWWEARGNAYIINNRKGNGESINSAIYNINMRNRFGWGKEEDDTKDAVKNLHKEIMKEIREKKK